ncbi:MAG: hypothetical protein ACREAQ_04755 [Nitrososphaera sp.]
MIESKPWESDAVNRQRSISGLSPEDRILRSALEEILMILGRPVQKAVVTDLETRGLYRNDTEYLEVGAVSECLHRFFGHKCAQLILVRAARTNEMRSSGALT